MNASIRLALAGALAVGIANQAVTASAQTYSFTRIADTTTQPALAGIYCLGMNDQGKVIVAFAPGSALELWLGDGLAFTKAVDSLAGTCASINDNGELAYGMPVAGAPGQVNLVRNTAGAISVLARSTTNPTFHSNLTMPSLNNLGNALYQSQGTPSTGFGAGIYIGPGGLPVYNAATDPPLNFWTAGTMNDSNTAVFLASRSDPTAPGGARKGIYRGSALPLLEDGDSVSGGTILIAIERPVINNAGTVAFVGRLDKPDGSSVYGIFSTADGTSVTLLGTSPVQRLSINDAGAVAFRRQVVNPKTGIYLGRPGAIDLRVIGPGDPLDGSTLVDAFAWEESLNNHDQIAFWAHLADGRQGVYRADPVALKALTIKARVSSCDAVSGKITLLARAPAGGLTVALSSNGPALAVPASVTVPARKTSVSFPITPSAVTANTAVVVRAQVGAQAVTDAVTVTPIGLASLTLSPNPVKGGTAVTGTVVLACTAAPAAVSVALSSAKSAIAGPAASTVIVPKGQTNATFAVTTHAVTTSSSVTIKASASGSKKSVKLTVVP